MREGKGQAVIKRFLAVSAAAVAVLAAGAGPALADYPPAMQAGAVSATTIVVGQSVDFGGGGFAGGSKVVVSVNKAVYATVVADGSSPSAFGLHFSSHVSTVAYARPVAFTAAAATGSSFKLKVTLQTLGSVALVGSGVAPDGTAHMVTAKVLVVAAPAAKPTASGLPFTGSAVLIPGVIVGAVMLAGGFLMLTTVRSRKAGARG